MLLLLLLLKQLFFLNNEIKDVVMFVSRWTKRHRRALISSNAIIDTIHTTPHQAGWQHCVRQWQLSSHGQTCQPNPCPFAYVSLCTDACGDNATNPLISILFAFSATWGIFQRNICWIGFPQKSEASWQAWYSLSFSYLPVQVAFGHDGSGRAF